MAKERRNINEIASLVVEVVALKTETLPENKRNPAAVALDKLGGLKGSKPRAENLWPKERRSIAKKVPNACWAKEREKKYES